MATWLLVGDSASVHVRRLTAELARQGIDVHGASLGDARPPGAEWHRIGGARGGPLRYAAAVPRLAALVRRLRPGVVHAHYVSSYGLIAATMPGGHHLVETAWGTDLLQSARHRGHGALIARALRRSDLITGDSDSLLSAAASLAPGRPLHRFIFGPPEALFDAPREREPIILSPRRHEANYRIDLVLEAWALAAPRLPGHRLVVSGAGPLTERLRRLAPPATEFVGELSYPESLDLVRRAGAVVSLPLSDASSASVLEGLAAGCAVLATDLEANREWLPPSHLVAASAGAAEVADRLVAVADRPTGLDRRWTFERQVAELVARVEQLPLRGQA